MEGKIVIYAELVLGSTIHFGILEGSLNSLYVLSSIIAMKLGWLVFTLL